MSWDLSFQTYTVYGNITEEKKKELIHYLEKLNETLGDELHISTKSLEDKAIAVITENGLYKYGSFRGVIKDLNKFIKNIIDIDKENIEVEVWTDGWCETDIKIYYYKAEAIRHTTGKAREFEKIKDNKDELIKKIKEDITYFEYLSDEERKDIEYQKAAMYAPYPSWTWEFGSEDFDELYSEDFVKSEEAIALAFKLETREKLLEKRILPNFINNIDLLKALLMLNPSYIKFMPKKLKQDKKLILKLIKESKDSNVDSIQAQYIDSNLYKDKEVMLSFLDLSPYSFEYASDELKKDYEYCSKAVKTEGFNMFNAIKNKTVLNENIVDAISNVSFIYDDTNLHNIKIKEELKNNLDVHKELFKNFVTIEEWHKDANENRKKIHSKIDEVNSIEELFFLCYRKPEFIIPELYYCMLPNFLIRDENFIKNVLELNKLRKSSKDYFGNVFDYKLKVILNDELLQDEKAIKMLMKNKIEMVFKPQFITTKEGVVAMLKIKDKKYDYGKIALRKLNEDLRNNLEVQKEYVFQKGAYSIREINPDLLKDKEVKKVAFENVYLGLEWVMEGDYGYFINEESSVSRLQDLLYIKSITNFNYDDLLLLVKRNPFILLYTKENYFNDKKMMMEAAKSNMSILSYAKKELLKDKDIIDTVLKAPRINPKVLKMFDKSVFSDKKIALRIIKKAPDRYEELSDKLKKDDDIIKYAKKYRYNLRYFPEKYKEDPEFVFSVIGKNVNTEWILSNYYERKDKENSMPLFSEELLNNKEFMIKLCTIDPGLHQANELHMLSGNKLLKDENYLKEVINIRARRYIKKKSEYIRLPKECTKTIGDDEKLSLEELYFILLNQDMAKVYFAEYMNNNVEYYKIYLAKQEIINSELDLENCNTLEQVIDELKDVRYLYMEQVFPTNLLKNEKVANYILSKYKDYTIEEGRIVRKLKNEYNYIPSITSQNEYVMDEEDKAIYEKYLKQKELILAGETDVNKIVFKQEEYDDEEMEYEDQLIDDEHEKEEELDKSEKSVDDYMVKFLDFFDDDIDDYCSDIFDDDLPF